MSSRLTLDCLIADDRRVMIQVLVDPAEADGPRVATWTATFTESQLHTSDDDSAAPGGWNPSEDNPMEQVGKVIGRVISLQQQRRDFEQLSMLLHLAMHNLLDAAKESLKEGQ